ncbi:MAG: calcium/proton exchanger [Gemmatimonadota bacterium]|nr:calcium/proton exchanger [Gemmatimonadota bacterium]
MRFRPSMNWLLVFLPVAVVLDRAESPAAMVFFAAGMAIIPLAALIVKSTEQIAERLGPAAGGLLNATFGNLPEMIIALVALKAGLVDMVRASLIGAILGNILFGQGMAFLLGGLRNHVQEYNPSGARTYASMLVLASITMAIPAAFHRFIGEDLSGIGRSVDVVTASILLGTYVCYLLFMLRTHPDFFAASASAEEHEAHESSLVKAGVWLVAASVGAAWMSEILVGAAEATGHALGMSPLFLGMVLLALIGGAAETGSAITMGRANKPDLAVGIAMGSSIQIALFVTPFLALVSLFYGPAPMALAFSRLEILALFLGALVIAVTAGDGRATWFKGVQLLTLYLILATTIYLIPVG